MQTLLIHFVFFYLFDSSQVEKIIRVVEERIIEVPVQRTVEKVPAISKRILDPSWSKDVDTAMMADLPSAFHLV